MQNNTESFNKMSNKAFLNELSSYSIFVPEDMRQEAIRRFGDRYIPEENKVTKDIIKDWSEQSDTSLKRKRIRLNAQNEKLPQKLIDELVKRFPNYDPVTNTFLQAMRTEDIEATWTSKSDTTLKRSLRHFRKVGNIPKGLEAEVIRRFPSYNPETTYFKEAIGIDWSTKTDIQLKNAIKQYRHVYNNVLPIKLKIEAVKRFPHFNPITNLFEPGKQKDPYIKAIILEKEDYFKGQVYDVFINGKPVIENKTNIMFGTYFEDSVFWISYKEEALQSRKTILYLPDRSSWAGKYCNPGTYITRVSFSGGLNCLRLKISDGQEKLLEARSLQKKQKYKIIKIDLQK